MKAPTPNPDYSQAGAARDVVRRPVDIKGFRDAVERAGTSGGQMQTYVMDGYSGSAAQTFLELNMGAAALGINSPGIPVIERMRAIDLAISWASDSVPAGEWTLHLWRRPAGALTFTDIATFSVPVS
jgi:hypothetical protein